MKFFLQRDNSESKAIKRTPFPNLAAVQRDLSEAENISGSSTPHHDNVLVIATPDGAARARQSRLTLRLSAGPTI
jgi:hypothetical protein